MPSSKADTLIVLATGKQDQGIRATLAFAWGCAALAMGQKVMLYLTMDGTTWAMRGVGSHVQVSGFEPLSVYLGQFAELGGEILVCAPCSEECCGLGSGRPPRNLVRDAKLAGLATIVSRIGAETNVVTF